MSRKLKTLVVIAIIMAATTYITYNALTGVSKAFDGSGIEWDD